MRKNQVFIRIERFGDQVPKEIGRKQMEISVYADANNIYEALAAAYHEAITTVSKYDGLPSFGSRSSGEYSGNEKLGSSEKYKYNWLKNGIMFNEEEVRYWLYKIAVPERICEKLKTRHDLYLDIYDFWQNLDYDGTEFTADNFQKAVEKYLERLEDE
jgi:hypothetical protein